MKQTLNSTARMTYGTRRLIAGDTFEASRSDARVLIALGKARPVEALGSSEESAETETASLRDEYERLFGRRPYGGWDDAKLREKIIRAKDAR
jgi:hypothetical protein